MSPVIIILHKLSLMEKKSQSVLNVFALCLLVETLPFMYVILKQTFGEDKITSMGCTFSQLSWSPELTPAYFWWRGYLKSRVYRSAASHLSKLKDDICRGVSCIHLHLLISVIITECLNNIYSSVIRNNDFVLSPLKAKQKTLLFLKNFKYMSSLQQWLEIIFHSYIIAKALQKSMDLTRKHRNIYRIETEHFFRNF